MNEFGALEIISTEEQDAETSAQIAAQSTIGMRNAYSVTSNAQGRQTLNSVHCR